jgi:pimeloyl-ACP methyl ester carboxylesterase
MIATLAFAYALVSAPAVQPQRSYCFSVQVVGKGKPVILIPGLTCTGKVFDGTVDRLKSKYRLYVLTLPGFGKQAPISGPYLSRVRDDIIAYVKAEKLKRPAVIGHSLGGFMTYFLAIAEPELWGPLIAVDGLPFLSLMSNPNATAKNMGPTADGVAKQMASATPSKFQAGIKGALSRQITDPVNVEMVNAASKDSDQGNVAEAMKELMTTDLRSQVSVIRSPLLLLGAGQQATTEPYKKALEAIYASEIKTIPHGKLVMDWKARHFIMLDDPEFFYKSVEEFLGLN